LKADSDVSEAHLLLELELEVQRHGLAGLGLGCGIQVQLKVAGVLPSRSFSSQLGPGRSYGCRRTGLFDQSSAVGSPADAKLSQSLLLAPSSFLRI
jgi:hypothetical protein